MGERKEMRRGYENMKDQLHKSGMPLHAAEAKAREIARRNESGRGVKPNPLNRKNRGAD